MPKLDNELARLMNEYERLDLECRNYRKKIPDEITAQMAKIADEWLRLDWYRSQRSKEHDGRP